MKALRVHDNAGMTLKTEFQHAAERVLGGLNMLVSALLRNGSSRFALYHKTHSIISYCCLCIFRYCCLCIILLFMHIVVYAYCCLCILLFMHDMKCTKCSSSSLQGTGSVWESCTAMSKVSKGTYQTIACILGFLLSSFQQITFPQL